MAHPRDQADTPDCHSPSSIELKPIAPAGLLDFSRWTNSNMEVTPLAYPVEDLGYDSIRLEELRHISASVMHVNNFCFAMIVRMA
jgi:hypothetical protein